MTRETVGGSAIVRGAALAAENIGAAVFLGFAGAIFAFGYDGLAFGLGLAGGLAILAVMLAPALGKLDGRSVPGFLAERFENRAIGVLAAVIVLVSAFVLLIAQIAGAGIAMLRLTGLEPPLALTIAAGLILLAYLISRARASSSYATVLVCLAIFAAFFALTVALSVKTQGPLPPAPAFTPALAQAQGLEINLIEQKLADPRSLRALTLPFLTFDPWNFGALLISLIAGCAVLPTAVQRLASPAGAGDGQRAAVWGLTFVGLFLLAVPAVAVFAKLDIYRLVEAATKLTELPGWIFSLGKSGLVQICGHDAVNADAVVAACSKVSGQHGVLRLQDFAIAPDAISVSAADIAELASAFTYAMLAGALLACGAGAVALLGVMVSACGGRSGQPVDRDAVQSWPARPVAVAMLATLAAAAAAITGPGDLVTLFSWGISLLAAGLFPAMLAALFWRRANPWAVLAAMAAGFTVALYYIVATRYFAPQFFAMWSPLSNASSAAASRFDLLQQAAEAVPGGAASVAFDRHARTIANWWGIKNLAAGIFGLPIGLLLIGVVSLIVPGGAAREDADA